ncbi:hypothetical protein PXH69_24615 [Rhodococcus qingshengii]|uniref:Uncharacterized protein n=1 Tax=Rhodococcus qingshengii TaxID=334542 RepID=A0AAW6LVW2_RHOSG|nr:hypothetical protein [Rhodococcus qingshengii]MDE8648155.1 hypothetical protein [Rhodococcus qingshengii]
MVTIGTWEDIDGIGEELNGLFRQSWCLLNEVGEELATGDPDRDELQDMFDELVALERKIQDRTYQRMLSANEITGIQF